MTVTDNQRAYFSESLARGLLVLRAFDDTSPRVRVSEVAKRTQLSRAVARRYLLTLCDLGYVGKEGDTFFLKPRVLDFGHRYFSSTSDLWPRIHPMLVELAERTREATTLGVLDGTDVLVLARASKRMFDLAIGSGSRLPLLQTSLGRVLAAYLADPDLESLMSAAKLSEADRERLRTEFVLTRRQQYALVTRELTPKLVAIAVPIYGRQREVVAALNVTSYTANPEELVSQFLPLLIDTRMQLESTLHSANNVFDRQLNR